MSYDAKAKHGTVNRLKKKVEENRRIPPGPYYFWR